MILYKYFSSKTIEDNDRLKSLADRKLYFASNEQLNDPFDLMGGQCFLGHQWIIRRLIHVVYTVLSQDENNTEISYGELTIIMRILLTEVQKYASCSFSRVPLERLMWAHYADCHKGFCLGFEVSSDEIHKVLYVDKFPLEANKNKFSRISYYLSQWIKNNRDKFVQEKDPFREFEKKENYIKFFLNNYKDFLPLEKKGINIDYLNQNVIKSFLCIKSQEWVYEQEERMIATIPYNTKGTLIDCSNYISLKEVILGYRFDSNKEKIIRGYFSNVDFYQVEIRNFETFDLSLKKI